MKKKNFLTISSIAAGALLAGRKASPADPSAGRAKGKITLPDQPGIGIIEIKSKKL